MVLLRDTIYYRKWSSNRIRPFYLPCKNWFLVRLQIYLHAGCNLLNSKELATHAKYNKYGYCNFFGAKIAKSTFFQSFHNKSLLFCFKSEWRFSWGFFWGILRFCKSKIGDFRIFASDFFHFDLGHFRYLLRPNYEPQRPQWGLKF